MVNGVVNQYINNEMTKELPVFILLKNIIGKVSK